MYEGGIGDEQTYQPYKPTEETSLDHANLRSATLTVSSLLSRGRRFVLFTRP